MKSPASTLVAAGVLLSLPVSAHAQFGVGTGGVVQLWNQNCASCHAADGRGANASSLLDGEYLAGGSDRELFNSTKNGIPDMGMPAYGQTMSDAEIWALTVHIRELQARHQRRQTGSPRPDAQGVYASQRHRFRMEDVVSGLQTPWAVDFLPDGRMLITERAGRLRIAQDGRLGPAVEGTPEVVAVGQGGLMEVAVHPDYGQNGWVYLAYTHGAGEGRRTPTMTRIVRGRLRDEGGRTRWVEQETVFEAARETYLATGLHFGCRIAFGEPDANGVRHLFFTIGERGRGPDAQDLARPNGKVHRITDDGRVPEDNPFVGQDGATPSIWTYGNRNAQGLTFDLRGNLWSTEHGPRGGDELNLIKPIGEAGRNFGWPLVSFGIEYTGAPLRTPWPDLSAPGREIAMPVYHWTPSIGACGLDVARGPMFPQWEGDLLAGGLSGQNVDRVRVEPDESSETGWRVVEREELLHGVGRVRDVSVGPDGAVYITLNDPDKVVRLVRVD